MSLSSSVLSAIGAAGQLFAGYTSVALGPIQFHGLAKPKSMPIGGRQEIALHRLPGGGRVLDAMGPDNSDIVWSGYLDGENASAIARALDLLRQSGEAVTLAWDVFSYQVLVSEFYCQTQHAPMPYKISCTVISDNMQVIGGFEIAISAQIASDLSNGISILDTSSEDQVIIANTINIASSSLSSTAATTLGSAAYSNSVNAVNAALDSIASANLTASLNLSPISSSLASLSTSAPIGVDGSEMSAQIIGAASACGELAQLAVSNAYVARSATNLLRVSA